MTRVRGILLGVAAVAVLHGAGWAYVTGRMRAEYATALDGMRRDGWSIAAAEPRRAGWPLSAALELGAVELDGTGAGVPIRFGAGQVWISLYAHSPGTLHIEPMGVMHLGLGGLPDMGLFAATLELTTDGTKHNLVADDLVVRLPDHAVAIEGLQAHASGLDVQVSVTSATPSPPFNLLVVETASLDAMLTQPWPGGPDPAAQASAWRDGGGTLTVRRLQARMGGLTLDAAGVAGLDGTLQPMLNLSAKVGGYRPALDRMAAAGAITASAATAAKAVLGLLSGRDAQAPATVPVRVGGGVLAVAGFPLLRLPPLAWRP